MRIDTAARRPLWWDAIPAARTRPGIDGDRKVDVAIIGSGFTGMWTAYHLAELRPDWEIVILEAEHVGYGASGRNGGWCHAEYPLGHEVLEHDAGHDRALAHMRALIDSVDDIGRIVGAESIDCDYQKGGVIGVARLPFQDRYAREEVEEARRFGLRPDEVRYLERDEAHAMLGATDVISGVWRSSAAAIHPAKLTVGLADAVERRDVEIFEGSRVLSFDDGTVETAAGTVTAGMVVRATEGYTSQFDGKRRDVVPLYSLMVATEPLPEAVWTEIGLHDRPVFHDYRNLIIYGQRTADGRLAFGGRGAPYHFGSRIHDRFDVDDGVHRELVRVLVDLFPMLADHDVTHRWGGPLGVPRDWRPGVVYDPEHRLAWAGGYVGDGVATSQLAGRTLAELLAGRETERTTLPWVDHRSRKWEPEPLRWIGINAGLGLAKRADRSELRRNKPSRYARIGNWLRGKG